MSGYLPAGAENDPNAPWNEKDQEFECRMCGEPMDTDKHYCSTSCFNADMR